MQTHLDALPTTEGHLREAREPQDGLRGRPGGAGGNNGRRQAARARDPTQRGRRMIYFAPQPQSPRSARESKQDTSSTSLELRLQVYFTYLFIIKVHADFIFEH